MSLLSSDYNKLNYDSYFNEEILVKLPKGKLGVELEKSECGYIVTQILNNSNVHGKLKVKDLCTKLNDVSLKNINVDKLELLFFKNIISERLLTIERKYSDNF